MNLFIVAQNVSEFLKHSHRTRASVRINFATRTLARDSVRTSAYHTSMHFLLQLTCLSCLKAPYAHRTRASVRNECEIDFATLTLADRWSAHRTSCYNELAYRDTQCVQASNCFW